ncbi:fam-a protein [Plasmodium vinckei lentum]|uniref:Fam-a protein n=1 Tax=Plasmodium vinckei lentum TaxID=138297 RepID=A0A6V7S1T4_PLAVN|nr:fam-a protein [Plasmodium vinckei lentum]
MKVMPVGLISLIIFNIVLANNTSDSGPTTNSCSLLEEKTKKNHKTTTAEPVNVKGKRPYGKGYEESYGDMVKDIFMPLEDNYQYSRNNSHKQDDSPPPVSKGPKKQKFTKKQQIRTINENDKMCQKPKDLLRTDPEKDTKTKEKSKTESATESKTESTTESKTKSNKPYSTPEEIYEKNKDLLCTNPKEIANAVKLMNEAATHLEHHATNEEDYEICKWSPYYNRSLSVKKHRDTVIQRLYYKYYRPSKYNDLINLLWDPDFANYFNDCSVKRKIVRMYNPNLVIIRQRYKSWVGGPMKYFYALAAKIDISEEKTIIVMTSANINDHHPSKKEYKNTIIENANLFTTDIDSNKSIRNGRWKKTFVNIAGYLIEKKDGVKITYLESIDGHFSSYNKLFIELSLNKIFHSNEKYVIS